MEHDKDQQAVDVVNILDMLKVEKAIQRTIKVAEKDSKRGGQGGAQKFFRIPIKARRVLDERKMRLASVVITSKIISTPHVRTGIATIWSMPGRILPGQYSITLRINV